MALGSQNTNNNGNGKGNYHQESYSAYSFTNPSSQVDATKLSIGYWNKLLKLSIAPLKKAGDNGYNEWDYANAMTLYIPHTKARILYNEIMLFLNDPKKYNNVGIPLKKGCILVSNGTEFGTTNPVLVMKDISEDGTVNATFCYEFNNFNYGMRNVTESLDFDKNTYELLELQELADVLNQYYLAMTGAYAYSVRDELKYDFSPINTKIGLIAEKLGVEFKGGNNKSSNKNSRSVFDNKQPKSNNTSLEDLENELNY